MVNYNDIMVQAPKPSLAIRFGLHRNTKGNLGSFRIYHAQGSFDWTDTRRDGRHDVVKAEWRISSWRQLFLVREQNSILTLAKKELYKIWIKLKHHLKCDGQKSCYEDETMVDNQKVELTIYSK